MSLKRLIKNCQKQDRTAQKKLYLRYCDLAMNISLRYTKDDHEAKDVVQNAFLNIFNKLDQFDATRGTFENWITRIVINEALQVYRKKQSINLVMEDRILLDVEEDPSILDQLQAEDILKLARSMPNGYRIIFMLAVVEAFNHKEIAEELGITESTSRSQLSRAKKLMRQLINEQKSLEHAKKVAG